MLFSLPWLRVLKLSCQHNHTKFHFQSKSLNNSFQFPLESFLKGDIKGVKGDLRKPFDKAFRDYESKL